MGIKTACTCGKQFMANDELAGQMVNCPSCGQSFRVPLKKVTPPPAAANLNVACRCGRSYQVPRSMAGRRVQCNSCGNQFAIPQITANRPPQPVAASYSMPQPVTSNPLDNLGDIGNFANAFPQGPNLAQHNPLAMSATYAPSMGVARPKAKKKRPINKKLVVAIASGSLVLLAIVGIAVATFVFLPDIAGLIGLSSPQRVWAAHRKAVLQKDWKGLYNTITPESREILVGTLAMAAQMLATQDQEMAAILKNHGLEAKPIDPSTMMSFSGGLDSMQQLWRSTAGSIKNQRAFYNDVMDHLIKVRPELATQSFPGEDAEISALKDLVVEGDTARARQTVSLAGRQREVDIRFKKVNGQWLIHIPMGP